VADVVDRVVDELIDRGEVDWVDMSEAWFVAKTAGPTSTAEEARALAIASIESAIRRGLMQLGDVKEAIGFTAWPLSVDDSIERLNREWPASMPSPEIGDIGWLCNTPEGDEFALNKRNAR
jgi:hypothetical protein